MYQTLVSSATSVSRIAGPVCITRLAMRPAKSFWKNAHDWRTTYQWFCHRMRFDTLAEIAWFAIRFCVERDRTRNQQHHRHSKQMRPEFREQLVRRARRDQGDDAPHEHGNGRIEQRDHQAGREQRREQALRLAGEMPEERDEARRRRRLLRWMVGWLQQPLEERKHGTGSKRIASAR